MEFTAGARIVVVGDDPTVTAVYAAELEANHYQVRTATTLAQGLSTSSEDCDLIVLCGLAAIGHSRRSTVPVIRMEASVAATALVRQVHRRVALRAMLLAVEAAAA